MNNKIGDEIIVKYIAGDANRDEQQKIEKWITETPENLKYFEQIKQAWSFSGIAQSPDSIEVEYEWIKFKTIISALKGNQFKKTNGNGYVIKFAIQYSKYAAIIILSIGLTWLLINSTSKSLENQSYLNIVLAPLGSKSKVILPDSTEVWLNASSKIAYNDKFIGKNREVKLEGEAYFKVKKDKKHPFIVKTSDLDIQVLGTSFNVTSYPDDQTIETTLNEGAIELSIKKDIPYNDKKLNMLPGEQTVYYKTDGKIIKRKVEDENAGSWKEGKLVFDSLDFTTLIKKLERRYDVIIFVNGKGLKNKRFTGTFKRETISQVLKGLSTTSPFHFTIVKEKEIYISE